MNNKKKLKIAIGTDAFPPTTDGISNVAQSYAQIINKNLGEAVVVTPKNPNQLDYRYDYQIYRYKSWWLPSKEGYSIGWPFKDELHQDIINMNFDLLHSHAPLATSYYFRRVVEKKKFQQCLLITQNMNTILTDVFRQRRQGILHIDFCLIISMPQTKFG